MTYPTIHPFNNDPVDPAYGYWPSPGVAGLTLGFCSPGAAVEMPPETIVYNPMDWQDGTMWTIQPKMHWTGNCWTGLTVFYVGLDGTVYANPGNDTFTTSHYWPTGYIFKDLPEVKALAIGVNVSWNGQFFAASVSFTDLGGYGPFSGIKGSSGAVYPNMYGAASTTPQLPWYSCQLGTVLCQTDCQTAYGLQTAPPYVSPLGYYWSMTNLISGYALAYEYGWPVIEYANADYFPAWVSSGYPISTNLECLAGNGVCNCLPYYIFNQWIWFPTVWNYSEVPMSNGYSLYVFRLAA